MRRKLLPQVRALTLPSPRFVPLLVVATLAACYSPHGNRSWADRAVYDVLDNSTEQVLGEKRPFKVERPVDTLRRRLMTTNEPVTLTLAQALDVAAENSRDFQRQKETLYLTALNLTTTLNDFRLRFGGGGGGTVDGDRDGATDVTLTDDLSAAASSVVGTRVVVNFVETFLRSVINGGSFDGSSILNMSITQPLLRGAGRHIAREPLTQSERNVIYAVRSFERFRSQFAIDLVADYWSIVRQMADLRNVEANYNSLKRSRLETEELFNAGRKTIVDLGRAKQDEYRADAQQVSAKNRLQTTLDTFKITLGLPVSANIELDPAELSKLVDQNVEAVEMTQDDAIRLALSRRYDYRTTVDNVEDVGRRVLIAENALNFGLDFTAAISVPTEPGSGANLDWERINWSAGVDLNLFLDRIPLRNAYRSQLITFDQTLRAREQAEDQLTASVRRSLRDIQAAIDTFNIQTLALELATQRVEATTDLYGAGRVAALEKLSAQDSFLSSQLSRNAAIVDYAIARLQLMNNLEAIHLQPQGLRFDMSLPAPTPAAE